MSWHRTLRLSRVTKRYPVLVTACACIAAVAAQTVAFELPAGSPQHELVFVKVRVNNDSELAICVRLPHTAEVERLEDNQAWTQVSASAAHVPGDGAVDVVVEAKSVSEYWCGLRMPTFISVPGKYRVRFRWSRMRRHPDFGYWSYVKPIVASDWHAIEIVEHAGNATALERLPPEGGIRDAIEGRRATDVGWQAYQTVLLAGLSPVVLASATEGDWRGEQVLTNRKSPMSDPLKAAEYLLQTQVSEGVRNLAALAVVRESLYRAGRDSDNRASWVAKAHQAAGLVRVNANWPALEPVLAAAFWTIAEERRDIQQAGEWKLRLQQSHMAYVRRWPDLERALAR